MKRELLTLGVTAVFALFLTGTSKRRSPGPAIPAEAAAPATTTATLPDTSAWKTYTSTDAQLTAKVPPGSTVDCTNRHGIKVCTVLFGMHIFAFSKGGNTARQMAETIRKTASPSSILWDTGDTIVVHRSDARLGEFCEMAASTAPGLTTVFQSIPGMDPKSFKSIAPQDSECLAVVAFAATLESTP